MRRAPLDAEAHGFVTRPWGGFETIEEGPGYKVKRLVVEPGGRLSLQRHRLRAESWIVVSGAPRVIVSGRARRVQAREMVTVPKGAWHRIENRGRAQVVIIEVQHGPYLGEDDIIRRQDDYGRADGAESPPRRGTTGRSSTPAGAVATSAQSQGPTRRVRIGRSSPVARRSTARSHRPGAKARPGGTRHA
jgi:mannose-6-phosphate isomerase-like protein (cupin superfamily)